MTDPIITTPTAAPVVETTETTSSEVSKPLVTAKPYDDDMLDAYEAEAKAEETGPALPDKKLPEAQKEQPLKTEAEKPGEEKAPSAIEETPLTKIINGKQVEFKIK